MSKNPCIVSQAPLMGSCTSKNVILTLIMSKKNLKGPLSLKPTTVQSDVICGKLTLMTVEGLLRIHFKKALFKYSYPQMKNFFMRKKRDVKQQWYMIGSLERFEVFKQYKVWLNLVVKLCIKVFFLNAHTTVFCPICSHVNLT